MNPSMTLYSFYNYFIHYNALYSLKTLHLFSDELSKYNYFYIILIYCIQFFIRFIYHVIWISKPIYLPETSMGIDFS